MGRDIDKTRDTIGVDELDSEERIRLLKDFLKHGGRVIGSLKKKDKGEILRKKHVAEIDVQKNKIHNQGTVKKARLTDIIKIQLHGFHHGVFTVGGNRLTGKFLKSLKKETRERLVELSLSLSSILTGEISIINHIRRASTGENSTFYEILVRLNELYDEQEYLKILKALSARTIPENQHLELIKGFFKKLYILGQFKSVCKMCLEKAVAIQGTHNNILHEIIFSVQDQLGDDLELIFGDCLLKFHLLLCKMGRYYYPLYSNELDVFLGISMKDRIGYLTMLEKKNRMERLRKERAFSEKMDLPQDEIIIPRHVTRGLPLLREALEKYEMLHEYDDMSVVSCIEKNDELYRVMVLFEIFDSQYSFILTTSKISFNIDYKDQKKVNIKEDLNFSYLLLNEAWDAVKEYIDVAKEDRFFNGDFHNTPYQSYAVAKALKKKRSILKRSTRGKILRLMKTVENILGVIITDYHGNNRLLQNPDDILSFDRNIDGEKNVDGKKVIEALMEAFLYCATFVFLFTVSELTGLDFTTEPKTA
jgi:hypothetical protein